MIGTLEHLSRFVGIWYSRLIIVTSSQAHIRSEQQHGLRVVTHKGLYLPINTSFSKLVAYED